MHLNRCISVASTAGLLRRPETAILPKRYGARGTSLDEYVESHTVPRERGMEVLNNSRLNKGMAFSLRERQTLFIHGLIPPAVLTQDQQAERVLANLARQPNDLARYVQLQALQDRNEKLFYRVLVDHVEKLMPIVYTPTVGQACQRFGFIYRKPKGIYLTINDNDVKHLYEMISNWPEREVKAVVMTDGERILGLGDLGAYGMGIPVGKLSLYVALAGIHPRSCLPICLDVGTDNQDLLEDKYYIGLRRNRVKGPEYDDFVDNVMKAVVQRFGYGTLIQFEDFANRNAFRFLEKYQNKYCTFNDDIQGTASVAVGGLMAATRITHIPLAKNKFLFFGAGEASLGIAMLTARAIMKETGCSFEEAKQHVFMFDSKGLIVESRSDISDHKRVFAQDMEPIPKLVEVVEKVKPTALIGCSTIGGAFTPKVLQRMGELNEVPVIFALSNPTSKSECTADEAYDNTEGRAVFASGSPFPKYTSQSHGTRYPGQGNNSYIFPGLALGSILCQSRVITDDMFLVASETLAGRVLQEHLDEGRVYPPLPEIREISVSIAVAVMEHCYRNDLASRYPEPPDKESFIRLRLYSPVYDDFMPDVYDWPVEDATPTDWNSVSSAAWGGPAPTSTKNGVPGYHAAGSYKD